MNISILKPGDGGLYICYIICYKYIYIYVCISKSRANTKEIAAAGNSDQQRLLHLHHGTQDLFVISSQLILCLHNSQYRERLCSSDTLVICLLLPQLHGFMRSCNHNQISSESPHQQLGPVRHHLHLHHGAPGSGSLDGHAQTATATGVESPETVWS